MRRKLRRRDMQAEASGRPDRWSDSFVRKDAAMRHADEEDERLRLIRGYVTPDQRYLKVGGALLGMSGRDRARFMKKLGKAVGEISPRELGRLVQGRTLVSPLLTLWNADSKSAVSGRTLNL
ncbi:DUF6000 family protein [Streptomyces sp. NPDC059755]|uniref:DUF6000 family protein n=1 Tax=Streptomyces sp. NPDC059755 TaxID=3346934 RepID=UPI00365B203E